MHLKLQNSISEVGACGKGLPFVAEGPHSVRGLGPAPWNTGDDENGVETPASP